MTANVILREARRRAGLTQSELASRAGTTQSAIARVERGRSQPTLERLSELVRACGLDLQIRLVPLDDHEMTLAQQNLLLSATERLEKMLKAGAFRGMAAAQVAAHGQ